MVNLFPTGQGNVIGNPIQPVVKITANPKTAESMPDHMDVDCSAMLTDGPVGGGGGGGADGRRGADDQRTPHRGRIARPPRIHHHEAVPQRLTS